ncbi:MAG: 3-hydroxyacyl-[acyl-carrier-protein] dehydratase FabZ [Robiginitomaculum sp.]|nr:MAG: 3-hydroxyacyl-[acyl-carrier-protein] dehydratase FabZ [Robiginitomaculum sp.]
MNTEANTISYEEILQWLLHRPPFLLLDHASHFVEGESLIGHKQLAADDPWFSGHFPGNPVMPGVMLIESMAQTGALLAAKSWNIRPEKETILFSSVEKAKFRNRVSPGDCLEIPVSILARKRNFVRFEGQALVSGKVVASCTFMAMTVENP